MAETKFVQYGDKKMPIGNLTLEQAKATMARFFPELADPKIETKKSGDETVYVFTKQAGRKGADAYTPGPWSIDIDTREGGANQIIDANDMTICFMSISEDENKDVSNARLIAAAPELLDACQEAPRELEHAYSHFEHLPPSVVNMIDEHVIAQVRAAIAKVRGEKP